MPLVGAGFSKLRACQLHRKGLRLVRDALAADQFLDFGEAQVRFGLTGAERGAWGAAIRALQATWGLLLTNGVTTPTQGEWVG